MNHGGRRPAFKSRFQSVFVSLKSLGLIAEYLSVRGQSWDNEYWWGVATARGERDTINRPFQHSSPNCRPVTKKLFWSPMHCNVMMRLATIGKAERESGSCEED